MDRARRFRSVPDFHSTHGISAHRHLPWFRADSCRALARARGTRFAGSGPHRPRSGSPFVTRPMRRASRPRDMRPRAVTVSRHVTLSSCAGRPRCRLPSAAAQNVKTNHARTSTSSTSSEGVDDLSELGRLVDHSGAELLVQRARRGRRGAANRATVPSTGAGPSCSWRFPPASRSSGRSSRRSSTASWARPSDPRRSRGGDGIACQETRVISAFRSGQSQPFSPVLACSLG